MIDQLRADLEALYHEVEKGWCQYGWTAEPVPLPRRVAYGEGGGCLSEKMIQVITQNGLFMGDRYTAMKVALGLPTWPDGLFEWNDDRDRTWGEVKNLVKDAIGKL